MRRLEPTYLRHVYDQLSKGSISSDNSSSLPYGFVGIFEKEFSSDISSVERSKILKRLSLWALFKRPVSTLFFSKLLNEDEELSKGLIDIYSNWFNSPEPGKYVLFHDRLRAFLLQKLSNHEIKELNEQIIAYLEASLKDSLGDESESYALEYLSHHMLVESQMDNNYDRLINYTNDKNIWSKQINLSSEYEWSQRGIQDSIKESSRRHIERDLISSISSSVRLKRKEESDVESIFQFLKNGEYETALLRANSISKNKRVRLFILMIHELTNGHLKNVDQKKEVCESVLNEFKKLRIDEIPRNIINFQEKNWSEKEITEGIIFESIVELKQMGLDYNTILSKYEYFTNSGKQLYVIFKYDNDRINNSLEFIRYIYSEEKRFEFYIAIFNKILSNHLNINNEEEQDTTISNEILIKNILEKFLENLNLTYDKDNSNKKIEWMSGIIYKSNGFISKKEALEDGTLEMRRSFYNDSFKKSDLISLCDEFIEELINEIENLNIFQKIKQYYILLINQFFGEKHLLTIINNTKKAYDKANIHKDYLVTAYIGISKIFLYANDLSASNKYFMMAIEEKEKILIKVNSDKDFTDNEIENFRNQLFNILIDLISRFTFYYAKEDQKNGDKYLNVFKEIFTEISSNVNETSKGILKGDFANNLYSYSRDFNEHIVIPDISKFNTNLDYLEKLVNNLLKAQEIENLYAEEQWSKGSPIDGFRKFIESIYSLIYKISDDSPGIEEITSKDNSKHSVKQLINHEKFEEAYKIDPDNIELNKILLRNLKNPDFKWIDKYKDQLISSCLDMIYYESLKFAGLNDEVKELEEDYLIGLNFHKNPNFDSYFNMVDHYYDEVDEKILYSFSISYNYNREQSKHFIYPKDDYYISILIDITPRVIFGSYLKLGEVAKAESFTLKIKESSTRSWCQFVLLIYYIQNKSKNYEKTLDSIDNYFIKIYGFIKILDFYHTEKNPKYSVTFSKLLKFISTQKCEFCLSKSYLIISAFLIESRQFDKCLNYYEKINKVDHKNNFHARLSNLKKNEIDIIHKSLENKKTLNELKAGIKGTQDVDKDKYQYSPLDLKDSDYLNLIDSYLHSKDSKSFVNVSKDDMSNTQEYISRTIKENFKGLAEDTSYAEDVNNGIFALVEVAKKDGNNDLAIETLDFISDNMDYINEEINWTTHSMYEDAILDFLYEKEDQEYIDFILNKYPNFGSRFIRKLEREAALSKDKVSVWEPWKPKEILEDSSSDNEDSSSDNIDSLNVYDLMIQNIGSNKVNYNVNENQNIDYLIEKKYVNKLTIITDMVKDDENYTKLSKLLIDNNKLEESLSYANKISNEEIKFKTICYIIKHLHRSNQKVKFKKLTEELKDYKMIGNIPLLNLSIAFIESGDLENALYFGDQIYDHPQETVKAALIYDSSEAIINSCVINNDYEIEKKTKPIIEKYFKDYNNEYRTLYLEEIYEIESSKIVFAIIEIMKNKKEKNIKKIYNKYCEHLISLYYKSHIVGDNNKVISCIKLSREFKDFKINSLSEKFISDSINHKKNIVLMNGEGGFAPHECPESVELEAYLEIVKYLYEIDYKDLKTHISDLEEFFSNNFSKIIKYYIDKVPDSEKRNLIIDLLIELVEILDLENSNQETILEIIKHTLTFINKLFDDQKRDEKILKLASSQLTYKKLESSLLEKSVQWTFEIFNSYYKKDQVEVYDDKQIKILVEPIGKFLLNNKSSKAYKDLIKEKIFRLYNFRLDRMKNLIEIKAPHVIIQNETRMLTEKAIPLIEYEWQIFKINYELKKGLKATFINDLKNRQIKSEEDIGKINDDGNIFINIDEDLISSYYYKLFELYIDNEDEKCYELVKNISDIDSMKLLLKRITSKHNLKESLKLLTDTHESISKEYMSSILSEVLSEKRAFDDDFYIFLSKYNNSIEEFEKLLTYILNTKMMYSKKIDKQNIDLLLEVIDIGELKDNYQEL